MRAKHHTQSIFKQHLTLIVSNDIQFIYCVKTEVYKLTLKVFNDLSTQKCCNIHAFQQGKNQTNYIVIITESQNG